MLVFVTSAMLYLFVRGAAFFVRTEVGSYSLLLHRPFFFDALLQNAWWTRV